MSTAVNYIELTDVHRDVKRDRGRIGLCDVVKYSLQGEKITGIQASYLISTKWYFFIYKYNHFFV